MPAHQLIDLRSDTVTRPSARMRAAMAEAEVGDDVYGEDPTVNRLEQRAAEVFGKEAGLFVPTGTMGNTIAAKLHTRHGEEVLCEGRSHILDWELSMLAWFSGCLVRPVAARDGILTWEQIGPALRAFGPHNAPTTLISLENTHNMAGGTVYPVEAIDEICEQAHNRGIKVHMDGARIFNASVATTHSGGTPRARCGFRHVLSLKGTRRSGRFHPGWYSRRHGPRPAVSQTPGWRHAPGGSTRRRRTDCARGIAGPPA